MSRQSALSLTIFAACEDRSAAPMGIGTDVVSSLLKGFSTKVFITGMSCAPGALSMYASEIDFPLRLLKQIGPAAAAPEIEPPSAGKIMGEAKSSSPNIDCPIEGRLASSITG